MKFIELKKHIQEKGVLPIYLFDGEELYFRDKGLEMLKSACLTETEFNYTSFDGKAGCKAIAEAVYTLPFLSDKRLVAVSGFYPTEKEYESILKPLFETPVETTVLVILNSGEKAKNGACDLKKKPNVTFVDCARADEETVVKWIYLTLKGAGIAIDGASCNAIASYCVYNMARISKEVEKLKAYAQDSGVVTLKDVDALVYKDAEYKIYELTQAAARKDHNTFMTVMDSMVGKGFDENSFLNALTGYFKTLTEVAELKGSNAQVAEILGMKEYAVKKSREQAARFKDGALSGYYADLYSAMAAARAGEITLPSALKTVIQKIFFKTY